MESFPVFVSGAKQIAKVFGWGERKTKTILKWEGCPVFLNEKGWPTVNVTKMTLFYEQRCREMAERKNPRSV